MWLPLDDSADARQQLSPKERRRQRLRRRKFGSVEMVVPPTPFELSIADDYRGDVYIWDLDKTYLRSEFSTLRGLLRTAVEAGRNKIAYPGASALLKALRHHPDGSCRPIFFVSASPPQLRTRILEKFAHDGIEIDGIYFKDNLRNVRLGRLGRLREQMGYKLLALLDLRTRLPQGAVEVTFGDDSENDPAVYATYSEILRGRFRGMQLVRYLEKQGVNIDEAVKIAWRARGIASRTPVRQIFITVHRDLDPRYYRRYGLDVIPTRNAFQAAVVLAASGSITMPDLTSVCEEVLQAGVSAPSLSQQVVELNRDRSLSDTKLAATLSWLRHTGVLT